MFVKNGREVIVKTGGMDDFSICGGKGLSFSGFIM